MSEKKRILVVDDEESVARAIQLYMEATERHEVRTVSDPRQALQTALRFQPDLAILDIVMPHMDGRDVAAELAAEPDLEGLPVVFLTALVKEVEIGGQGGAIGGHPLLAKPVEPADLIALVDETLGETLGD